MSSNRVYITTNPVDLAKRAEKDFLKVFLSTLKEEGYFYREKIDFGYGESENKIKAGRFWWSKRIATVREWPTARADGVHGKMLVWVYDNSHTDSLADLFKGLAETFDIEVELMEFKKGS